MTETQTIPCNVEAEEALLGSVLINPPLFSTIELQAGDFYIERHQWIWQAMAQVVAGNQVPDHVSLSEKLSGNGKLKGIGGPAFLAALVNRTPTSLHAEQYAEIIRDKSCRRKMIRTARELTIDAFDQQSDVDQSITGAVDDLTSNVVAKHELVHVSERIPEVMDLVDEAVKNPDEIFGVPTGFIDWDRLTGGLLGLWYLIGPPGIGKSILMLNVIINAAKEGCAGAIFSLEMKTIAQLMRAVSAEAKIATRSLKTGLIPDEQFVDFYTACQVLADLPIYICDDPMLTTTQLNAHVLRLKPKIDLKIIALDYLYLMGDDYGMDSTPRTEILSGRIKAIQRTTDIAFLTVNSVTKAGMNGKTNLSDMRGSGQLPHDADGVITINKHEMYPNIRTLELQKGRDIASAGSFDLVKSDSYPLFQDATAREVPVRSQYFTGDPDEPIP